MQTNPIIGCFSNEIYPPHDGNNQQKIGQMMAAMM